MKNRLWVFVVVVLMGISIGLIGCRQEQPAAPEDGSSQPTETETTSVSVPAADQADETMPEQTVCPVMGNPIDPDIFVEYEGKKVYFCCSACVDTFKADPEKYLSKLPQFQK